MNKTITFSTTVAVKGDYPASLLQQSESVMMVCGEHKAIFVDVDTMD